jgi:hypothetical protein
MVKCKFEGCLKEAVTMNFCQAHYKQFRQGKELKPLQLQYHGLSEYDRFMRRVEKGGPKECWNWTGSRMKKDWHGQWRNQVGSIELAHRAAWRMMKGEIPAGLCVLHKCDNPICCNPTHLFLGTHSDNFKDMWGKGRARPKSSLGEKHGMSRLTTEKVLAIRASTSTECELAVIYGVSPTTIGDIRRRKTWKHI